MKFLQRSAYAFAVHAFLAGAAAADVVVRVEDVPAPTFSNVYGVSNIAADGTVVGWSGPPFSVVRWRPGQPAEDLGGDIYLLSNVTPLIARNGSAIAATILGTDAAGQYREMPSLWSGGTQWQTIAGLVLASSAVYGISDDGTRLAGVGDTDDDVYGVPWIWSAQTGQVVLPQLPGRSRAEAWGVSNDGRVAIGYADDGLVDRSRYGVQWTDGAITALTDAQQRPLGHAIACNSDCSVIIGSGFGIGGPGSPQAWRKTAQGVEYLGEVAGAQPGLPYYAMETSEDGTMIVGIYMQIVEDGSGGAFPIDRAFVWTPAEGIVDFVAWLASRGVDYGADLQETAVISMSGDGRRLLFSGADADYNQQRAVIRIDPETVFANGFE